MTPWRFFLRFLKVTFEGVLDRAHLWIFGGFLGLGFLGLILHWEPDAAERAETWRTAAWVVVVFLVLRAIRAPYVLFKEEWTRAEVLQAELADIHKSPLELTFDVKNPDEKFWFASSRLEDEDRDEEDQTWTKGIEYNVLVRNRSGRTVHGVECLLNRGYEIESLTFARTKGKSLDMHPNTEEWVILDFFDPIQNAVVKSFPLPMIVPAVPPREPEPYVVILRGRDAAEVRLKLRHDTDQTPIYGDWKCSP